MKARRYARPEDPEGLRYIASCWERDPQMVTALAGLDRDRVREAGRNSWHVRDGYTWVGAVW